MESIEAVTDFLRLIAGTCETRLGFVPRFDGVNQHDLRRGHHPLPVSRPNTKTTGRAMERAMGGGGSITMGIDFESTGRLDSFASSPFDSTSKEFIDHHGQDRAADCARDLNEGAGVAMGEGGLKVYKGVKSFKDASLGDGIIDSDTDNDDNR